VCDKNKLPDIEPRKRAFFFEVKDKKYGAASATCNFATLQNRPKFGTKQK
jgi:hypothetical protein